MAKRKSTELQEKSSSINCEINKDKVVIGDDDGTDDKVNSIQAVKSLECDEMQLEGDSLEGSKKRVFQKSPTQSEQEENADEKASSSQENKTDEDEVESSNADSKDDHVNGKDSDDKEGNDSISLSTLISTIIKGTVASMDGVGKDIPSCATEKTASTPTLSEQHEEVADSDAADQGDCDNLSRDQSDEEDLDTSGVDPSQGQGDAGSRRRRGRRTQHRFTLNRVKGNDSTGEIPQIETIETEHGRIYQCISCKVSFNFEQDMRMHLQTHLRPRYFCPVCSRRFLNQSTMERHMVTHDQIKPYVCSVCSQGFRIKSNLNRHYQRLHNKVPEETRRGRPLGSTSKSTLQPDQQEDERTSRFSLPKLNDAPVRECPPYPSTTHLNPLENKQYPVHSVDGPMTRFVAPHGDNRFNLYEKSNIPPVASHDIVRRIEANTDGQIERNLEVNQSSFEPYTKVGRFDLPKRPVLPMPESEIYRGEGNDRISDKNSADYNDPYAQLFLSRYPDVESAVEALRKIETERLFHQELLLEELKLRSKYGLPTGAVLDDLRKEISVEEKLGRLDSFMGSGNSLFPEKTQAPPNVTLIDKSDSTGEYPHRYSPLPACIPKLPVEPLPRKAPECNYAMTEFYRRPESEGFAARPYSTDSTSFEEKDRMASSLSLAQLQQMVSQNVTPRQSTIHDEGQNPLSSHIGMSPRPPLPEESAVCVDPKQNMPEPTLQMNLSQYMDSMPQRSSFFLRPRRGRRRLASMPSVTVPPPTPHSLSPANPRPTLTLPSHTASPSRQYSHVVHHRPFIPQGRQQVLPPPPLMHPPPIPLAQQQADRPPFASSTIPSVPFHQTSSNAARDPEPKRLRQALSRPMIAPPVNSKFVSPDPCIVKSPPKGAYPSSDKTMTEALVSSVSDLSETIGVSRDQLPNTHVRAQVYEPQLVNLNGASGAESNDFSPLDLSNK